MSFDLPTLLFVAGLLHFCILIAGLLVPGAIDYKRELGLLSPLTRQLVTVYAIYIFLLIVAFGVLTVAQADALASGTPLARCVAALIAGFWGLRLGLQLFYFTPGEVLARSRFLRVGYHGLTVVFLYFTFVYTWAVLVPAGG